MIGYSVSMLSKLKMSSFGPYTGEKMRFPSIFITWLSAIVDYHFLTENCFPYRVYCHSVLLCRTKFIFAQPVYLHGI